MMKSPMHEYLDMLLDKADPKGQATVMIQFKMTPQIARGALRRAEGVAGMFELLTIAQDSPNSQPFPLYQFFEASEVSRVMVVGDASSLPTIVAPPQSGIVAPA